ncbi:MAG TPA: metal-dependent hydrolase [Acidobacteriota bacterium]|nr:metal-dependent hydrolase [Acidobacteriota bacterium]
MENITHTITGLALAQTSWGRRVPYAPWLLAFAANAPDLEIFSGGPTRLHYFYYHRGITHSVLGIAGLAIALSLVAWGLGRRRGLGRGLGEIFWPMSAALLSHLLLDYFNSYGVRPWLPLSDRWVYGDLVFIADPTFWAVLGLGIYYSSHSTKGLRWIWVTVGFLFSLACIAGGWMGGTWLWVLWAVTGIVLVIGWNVPRPYARAPLWSFALLGAYLLLLIAGRELARVEAVRQPPAGIYAHAAEGPHMLPVLGDPLTWEAVWETNTVIHTGHVNILSTRPVVYTAHPRNLDLPVVEQVLTTCAGRTAAHFSRFACFKVEPTPQGEVVVWYDLRFGAPGTADFGMYRFTPGNPGADDQTFPCPSVGSRRP